MGNSFAVITLIFGCLIHPFLAGAAASSRVVLAHGALNARIAPLWIAHEQKFFAKYGVDSTVLLVRQIQIMVSGLGTGEIDLAMTSGSTLLGAAGGGLDAKMVARVEGIERIGRIYIKSQIQTDGAQDNYATSEDYRSCCGRRGLSGSVKRTR
jgi:hypothetical protein